MTTRYCSCDDGGRLDPDVDAGCRRCGRTINLVPADVDVWAITHEANHVTRTSSACPLCG